MQIDKTICNYTVVSTKKYLLMQYYPIGFTHIYIYRILNKPPMYTLIVIDHIAQI